MINEKELLSDNKLLANAQDLYRDLAAGDPYALKKFDDLNLDKNAIKTALAFLTQNNNLSEEQKANLLQDSWRVNFRAKPPTPEEFLTEKYLGYTAKSLYPRIIKTFTEFMNPTSGYRNLILYPHIGWGKSFLSTLIVLYLDTYISLMRDPCKYFGLSKATSFSSMLISYSLKKSSELLVAPFLNILESSPFFEKVSRRDTMADLMEEFRSGKPVDKLYYTTAAKDKSSVLEFDSGLSVKVASSPQALLGLTLISATYSELSFFTDAGKSSDFVLRLWNDGVSRVESRLHGNYLGRCILDSSPNSLMSAIDDWIVNESWKNSQNYIIKGSMWEWDPKTYEKDFKTGNTFKVYTGGKGQPPRILEALDPLLDDPSVDQSKIIEVPGSMKQYFIDDLPKALKDRAGIPSGVADNIISDYTIIEDMFDNNLKNVYTNIYAPANENPNGLIWNQIKDIFFKNKAGQYEYYYLPTIPRCISVDQSVVSDVTSISMAHVERLKDSGDEIFVVDFTITIVPTKEKINLEAIRCFIEDLRTLGHLQIDVVSFDQFQSEVTIQNLKRNKFEVEKLSVDRTTGPYLNLISLMNQRRIKIGKNIFLKNNLKCLHFVHSRKSNHIKIDHDASRAQVLSGDSAWEKSFIGYYGKDVSDSVAAVVELCSKTYPVAQINWEGGPESSAFDEEKEKEKALNQLLDLMNKFGFKA